MGVYHFKSIMTAEERGYDTARNALPAAHAASKAATAHQGAAQAASAAAITAVRTFPGPKPSPAFDAVRNNITQSARDFKTAKQQTNTALQDEKDLFNAARHKSRETAQNGIVKLSQLANVDVERWRY
jgi:hypothetical protein